MPQTARPTRKKSKLVAHDQMPRGISVTNEELSENAIRSIGKFYGLSEILSYYSPQFPLDTASIVERIVREALQDTLAQIHNLLAWKVGWNGYNSLAPDYGAVLHADNWIVKLFLEVAELDRVWIRPNVTAGPDGEVVFEWWYGTKKLTIYISDQNAEYVQVLGTDIHSGMSDGDAESISMCRSLWLWLTS
jgi:hypothetical protein